MNSGPQSSRRTRTELPIRAATAGNTNELDANGTSPPHGKWVRTGGTRVSSDDGSSVV